MQEQKEVQESNSKYSAKEFEKWMNEKTQEKMNESNLRFKDVMTLLGHEKPLYFLEKAGHREEFKVEFDDDGGKGFQLFDDDGGNPSGELGKVWLEKDFDHIFKYGNFVQKH